MDGLMLGTVVQNRVTRRYRRVCGAAAGQLVLRAIDREGRLGVAAACLPWWLVWVLYRPRPDLVAPWEGRLHRRGG
jgi:hypothetical protein